MTVREVMECCTSAVWITLDVLVKNTENAEDVLSDWILDHDIHLMHCSDDRLIVSLSVLNDAREENT